MNFSDDLTRRKFLQNSAIATAAMAIPTGVFAAGAAPLKVGVIGCGGRGSGAAGDALAADKDVVIWSMGDVFPDRMSGSKNNLKNHAKERFQVTDARTFVGFDAYKGVIASGCDVVILATPPGFRPTHFKAAIEAGKHVFMEKPVATDAPGIRMVIEAAKLADTKGLNVVAGTQRRHGKDYRATMERIHNGDIGDITALYAYWNQGGLWMNPRQPGWSDMEWQLRNWLYFSWLSGDHITEQHVHNIDVCNWAMKGHPVKALCLGGREVRKDAAYGHIFDHFATEYEYANGVKMMSMCRQIDGTDSRVSEFIMGSKGRSNAANSIWGEKEWKYSGDNPNHYVQEHVNLYAAIKGGKRINEGVQVAESTLTAIMGRMSAYTGKQITWDQALNSTEVLVPAKFEMGSIPVAAIAVPGQTKFQ